MKFKTRKSALKRIKIKKTMIVRKKAYKSHLLINKNSKRLRHLSKQTLIHKVDIKTYLKMLK
jgi:ribosomal protein L35